MSRNNPFENLETNLSLIRNRLLERHRAELAQLEEFEKAAKAIIQIGTSMPAPYQPKTIPKSILALIQKAQSAVAVHFETTVQDIMADCCRQPHTTYRMLAIMLCREMGLSLEIVGQAFGKDHGTVLHAYRAIRDRMDVDEVLRNAITTLRTKLGIKVEATPQIRN
jgi:chromosomal replication initiation ATPase DnaA